jgi:methylated-DNA-protein-cysteine methyltransferase-like protein
MPTNKLPLPGVIAATIRKVPRGRVSTYGAIAKAAGYPRYARYVARVLTQAKGLPWQRIVGSGGRILLRGEAAFEQRFLLEGEGVRFRGRKVDLKEFEHQFSIPRRAPGKVARNGIAPKKATRRKL